MWRTPRGRANGFCPVERGAAELRWRRAGGSSGVPNVAFDLLGCWAKKNLAKCRQGAAELSQKDLGGLKCCLVRIAEMHHPNSMEVAVHFRLGSRQPLLASSHVLLLFAELVTATKARPVT